MKRTLSTSSENVIHKEEFLLEGVVSISLAQQRLLSNYPLLFRAALHPRIYRSNIGYWGIQCGPGWLPIIEKAARKIEAELRTLLNRLATTSGIASVDRRLQLFPALSELGGECYEGDATVLIPYCTEIREASGELHISLSDGYLYDRETSRRIRAAVNSVQIEAKTRCERCGKPGHFREVYWQRVYCDACAGKAPN